MPMRSLSADKAASLIADDIRKWSNSDASAIGYLFLLGAGASYTCDIPLAKHMVTDLTKTLKKEGRWDEPKGQEDKVRDYQWVMSRFNVKEQIDIVRRYIEYARATDGRWKLNHCYLVLSEIWKMYPQYRRTLLTTNFDPLFHYALLEQNIEAKIIRYFSEMKHMQPFDTEKFPTIIYLHGYWQNHHLYNDISSWRKYRGQWVDVLLGPLQKVGLVVLGYSGHPEDLVMKTLLQARKQYDRIAGDIYWCHLEETQISNDTYVVLDKLGNVVAVPIRDADSFMLQIGEALRLPEIMKISAFASVIKGQPPGFIWQFYNHATVDVEVESSPERSSQRGVTIRIKTDPEYEKPGENYAGIDIYTVRRLFDFSKYSQVTLEYDAILSEHQYGSTPTFEFKLQSAKAAHIENIPIGLGQEVSLPLTSYSEDRVDLRAVDRIVIAANCEQIGCGSSLEIKLRRIAWS